MSGAVQAQINYILPTDEKPVTYLTNPGSKPAQRNAEYQEVEVTIRDASADGRCPRSGTRGLHL